MLAAHSTQRASCSPSPQKDSTSSAYRKLAKSAKCRASNPSRATSLSWRAPAAHKAGVAILIKMDLACYVRGEPYRDAGGRLICITLKGFSKTHQQTLLIASVYMPTGLDNRSTRTPEHAVAKQLHQLIREKVAQHSLAIVAGDFNETLTKADRSVNGKNNSFALIKLTASVMTDTFRALHPLALAKEAHTNVTTRLGVTTTARLDYVLTKSSAIAGQECLTPVDARVGGELISSTHLPLIVTVKTAMVQPSPPPQPRPALRTARVSKEEIQDFVDTVAEKLLTKNPGPTNFADSLRALNETVFRTGADVVGQKGKRTLEEGHTHGQTAPAVGGPGHGGCPASISEPSGQTLAAL
jgi:exonuclease III